MPAPSLKETSTLDLERAVKSILDEHRYAVRAYVVNGDERVIPFVLGSAYIMLGVVEYPLPNPAIAVKVIQNAIMDRVTHGMAEAALIRRSTPQATPEMLAALRARLEVRKVVFDFMALSFIDRIKIAQDLGVLARDTAISDTDEWKEPLNLVKERNLWPQLVLAINEVKARRD